MHLKDMLLFYSFSQIKGISEKMESEQWHTGDGSLLYHGNPSYCQQSLFGAEDESSAYLSVQALKEGNASFFAERLAKKHYYRIAYSFPHDVMFLDIETTGLSVTYHYVTMIGWMMNGKYDCWLQGTDPARFLKAFRSAKLIVTFNGVKFDCKFLDYAFQSNEFSQKPNLDLMYLCRRFALKDGQKSIEKVTGFTRPEELSDTDGKEAVALWYSFLFGDSSALRRLVFYNFYDVIGMAYILDWVFFHRIYGKEFPEKGLPLPFFSEALLLDWTGRVPSSEVCDAVREYVKRTISDFSREQLFSSNPFRIVGIDLAGKVESRTGLCLLVGNQAETAVAHTNDDIVQFVRKARPDLISIDAPLSLPKGRTIVYDDDPMRACAGITRYCERELKRRNVNCYPALIRSMQELTRRGIELAGAFRASGYPVIECFPGAAQDVIQLPRKRTDESLLKRGLQEFGLEGDFRIRPVCHDELDAVTAALVGQFFISDFYEPLGIPEENNMIIPQKEQRLSEQDVVIGLAGPVAVGKTEAGNYIKRNGYHYIRYSQVIEEDLLSCNHSASRDDLRRKGWEIYSGSRQYALNQRLADALRGHSAVVIDGMRHLEDYTFWKERAFLRFRLVYIDADYSLRQQRFQARAKDAISYDMAIKHPVEAHVEALRDKADFIIENNQSLEQFYRQLDTLLPVKKFQ